MQNQWKYLSFWIGYLPWLSAAGVIIMFLKEPAGSPVSAMWLIFGVIAFLVCKAFTLFVRAAEVYLGIYPQKGGLAGQKMENIIPLDASRYRAVSLVVEGLYSLDRTTIAKACAARKGDKVIVKKGGVSNYPYHLYVFLSDGTYIGHVDDFYSSEVYALYDHIMESFVEHPIGPSPNDRLAISVILRRTL